MGRCAGCDSLAGMTGRDLVGAERALPWALVEEHDAHVRHLSSDASQTRATTQAMAAWAVSWGRYLVDWSTWTEQAASNVPVLLPKGVYGDEHGAEFDRFVARYNELLRSFVAAGGKTGAVPSAAAKPPWEKWLLPAFVMAAGLTLIYVGATTFGAVVARRIAL